MRNLTIITYVTLFFTLVFTLPIDQINGEEDILEFSKWAESAQTRPEKVTKLHFYFHDTMSGKNPSVVKVAEANMTSTSPSRFSQVFIMDDPLTVGPDPNSTLLGRSQGIYAFADQRVYSLIMVTSFAFTQGKYNGSSLSIVSHNPIQKVVREVSVVGGTGYFRMARGVAWLNTTFVDFGTGDAIVEYHVVVFHH